MNKFFKVPYYFIKRHIKKFIIGYLIAFLPFGYIMTASTTKLNSDNPDKVIQSMINSGPINIATAGLYKPLLNGLKVGYGPIQSDLGKKLHNKNLERSGENISSSGESWFNIGAESSFNKSNQFSSIINSITNSHDNSNTTTQDNGKLSNFNYNQYPDYYKSLGLANLNAKDFPQAGKFDYSKLDNLGRTGTAKATINYDAFKKSLGVRQHFRAGSEPSGWGHNEIVSIPGQNGKSYHGYMYNRSHLIGDALGGDAIKENAITGTRNQNVGNINQQGGMRYIESKVEKYIASNKNNVVYYKSEPVYKNNEQLPRYVIVYAMSNDKKINEKIQVFNNANGWKINYNTGAFSKE